MGNTVAVNIRGVPLHVARAFKARAAMLGLSHGDYLSRLVEMEAANADAARTGQGAGAGDSPTKA